MAQSRHFVVVNLLILLFEKEYAPLYSALHLQYIHTLFRNMY